MTPGQFPVNEGQEPRVRNRPARPSGRRFSNPARCYCLKRIIFSVDWPYESNKLGVAFLNRLSLSPAEMEMLAHGNAERVLKL